MTRRAYQKDMLSFFCSLCLEAAKLILPEKYFEWIMDEIEIYTSLHIYRLVFRMRPLEVLKQLPDKFFGSDVTKVVFDVDF